MKTRRLAVAALAGAALIFAGSARVEAQPSTESLSEQGYERLRGMSGDLDRTAQRAADQAQHSRSYANDRNFQRSVSNFARRAHAFDQRLATYRARPWQVDAEMNGLLADARSIEVRLEQSRQRDPRLLADWNRTVQSLDRMIEIYREHGRRGAYANRRDPSRDERSGRTEGPAYRDDRGNPGGRSSTARLVSDVSERANRLAERARQLSGPIPADERQRNAWQAIQKLAQDAAALGTRIDRDGEPRDLRASVAKLNAEAAEADRQMRAGNVFPEIKTQWADLMQAVARLRQSAGA